MTRPNPYLAGNLRRARERAGYSQTQLSHIAGVTRSTITRIELGKRHGSIGTLRCLALALRTSIDALLAPPKKPRKSAA